MPLYNWIYNNISLLKIYSLLCFYNFNLSKFFIYLKKIINYFKFYWIFYFQHSFCTLKIFLSTIFSYFTAVFTLLTVFSHKYFRFTINSLTTIILIPVHSTTFSEYVYFVIAQYLCICKREIFLSQLFFYYFIFPISFYFFFLSFFSFFFYSHFPFYPYFSFFLYFTCFI